MADENAREEKASIEAKLSKKKEDQRALAAGVPMMKHLNIVAVPSGVDSDTEDAVPDAAPDGKEEKSAPAEPTPPPPRPPNALSMLASVHKPMPIPQLSPSSASSASSPVHLALQSSHPHKKSNFNPSSHMCLYLIAFLFLFLIEPVLFVLNLLWVHVFPPLIESENVGEAHKDIGSQLLGYVAAFVLWPLTLSVFKKGWCNQKDASVFGFAYIFYILLVYLFLVIYVVIAAVIAFVLVIVSLCLYIVLALLVAIFAVLCYGSSFLHRIVAQCWTELIAPFFDHPIVSDIDNDLCIMQMDINYESKLFIAVGIIGAILYFPITLFTTVLFGLQQTVRPILRISFVHVMVPMIASTAMWSTALIFFFVYYTGTEQYELSDISSVESVKTSMIFMVSSLFSFLVLIISSVCIYRKHCVGAEVTPFPGYICLLPGFIFIGPIMLLLVPFWADSALSFSWYLWDMIWFKRKEDDGGIDFDAARVRSYSKTLAQKNKKRRGKSSESVQGDSTKSRVFMMISWVIFGIPTFLVYPIAFICEPLPNFPYNHIIVPFCNSLLFWSSTGTCAYFYVAEIYTEDMYITIIFSVISLIVLIVCSGDSKNMEYMSNDRERSPFIIFPWIFFANLLSFPATIFGLVWPAWPMRVMQHFNTDADIATKKAKQSGIVSPKFWANSKTESTSCNRILACVFCVLAIPMLVVWIVSFGCYNIFKYEAKYYVVTFLCSLLICASWLDYYFEFYKPDVSLIILVISGLWSLMLSYFLCNAEGSVRIAIQFVQNFLSIIYFCVIFTFGLYGLSISFLSFVYYNLLAFCGVKPENFEPKHAKKPSSIHYVE